MSKTITQDNQQFKKEFEKDFETLEKSFKEFSHKHSDGICGFHISKISGTWVLMDVPVMGEYFRR